MTPHLMIIRGLPGSGKSTLARNLEYWGVVQEVHEADHFFMVDGEYEFDRANLSHAHMQCEARVSAALREGNRVAVANTFTRRFSLYPYYQMCKNLGIEPVEVICTGRWQNVHGVDREQWEAMAQRFDYRICYCLWLAEVAK
jgi:predicted kinase